MGAAAASRMMVSDGASRESPGPARGVPVKLPGVDATAGVSAGTVPVSGSPSVFGYFASPYCSSEGINDVTKLLAALKAAESRFPTEEPRRSEASYAPSWLVK